MAGKRSPQAIYQAMAKGSLSASPQPDQPLSAVTDESEPYLAQLRLTDLVDSPYQPRKVYDPEEIDRLASSANVVGKFDEPIQVRKKADGTFEILAGHRRSRAAQSLGWTEIEALVFSHLVDADAHRKVLANNGGRTDLSDWESSCAMTRALDEGICKTQSDLAAVFTCSQATVSERLSMQQLPRSIIDRLNHSPNLFGRRLARTIRDLMENNPDHEDTLVTVLDKLLADGADHQSLKTRFDLAKAQKNKGAPARADFRPRIITHSNGAVGAKVSASSDGTTVTVKLKPGFLEQSQVMELIAAALTGHSDSKK